MVYRRYGGNAKDIFSMPFFDGCEMIAYAQDAECEEKLYMRWIAGYQLYMGFDEFKKEICISRRPGRDSRTAEEILDKVKGIIG